MATRWVCDNKRILTEGASLQGNAEDVNLWQDPGSIHMKGVSSPQQLQFVMPTQVPVVQKWNMLQATTLLDQHQLMPPRLDRPI